tara:strand:+ start:267 stop:554 length:288 start_codon:yes stop_codon:yes gene_type:complete
MGMSYDELYNSTPRNFNNKLIGFNAYQEQLMQDNWERTRVIIHSTLSPHSKKKLKPKEILPFPWDDKNKVKKQIATKEQIQEALKKYEKIKPKKI